MARTILITGCSTGIGLDAAQTLARKGWHVIASARKPADVDRLKASGLDAVLIDYADEATIASGFDAAVALTGGRLDALFNNGAWAVPGPLEDVPTAALRANFEANLFGWHDLTTRAIRVMRPARRGRIIQCSSVLGLVGAKYRGAYVATKFALEGYSDVLRQEMAGTGIDVVLIEPGPIDTPFRANAISQFERWIDWRASARRADYEATLLDMLYKGSDGKMQWPASAVTTKLVRALTAPRPRARYYVTTPTHIAGVMRRALPARLSDWLLARS
ncbi:SDR family NAD(P)-dependent oxidoreductase [Roseisalinus antarcticus]|uniref:D-beta-hydroxybutyrate dehydrogenase n=1 Tax=Roseisalinus antarcticus TaxID=254357 RepID=A0A1Y5SUN1_9RHOB|nr:SDR family NAD(P)-dependent oxidoreductase [Roseisalinus antarcticus]SLN45492.1 D-beta-hydroxybutyrate dehydrogenase [Roseisalinus antarcticus]